MAPLRLFRFWFLISTWAYEFRLIRASWRAVLFPFLLLFLCRRQKYFWKHWQLGLLVRGERFDEVRRDHCQQLICRFLNRSALEEVSEYRNVSQIFHLGEFLGHVVIDQTRNGEALAVLQQNLCFSLALRKRRNQEALQRDRIGEVESADFRRNLQVDRSGRGHGRGERELHSEGLELHRNHGRGRSAARRGSKHRERERTARQETGFFPLQRDQIRLGQNLNENLLLHRFDCGAHM